MALATWGDLIAIGAIPGDATLSHPKWVRAERLLEMASAQCVVYLQQTDASITEATITADWSAEKLVTLAVIVAEVAAQRLTASAADTAQQLADGYGAWSSAMLAPRHQRALDALNAGSSGMWTATLTRGDENPIAWAPGTGGVDLSDETKFAW